MAIDYPWFKSYDKGVPHSLEPYPAGDIFGRVEDAAKQKPCHPFLFFKGNE